MRRAWVWILIVVSAAAILLSGCSESEVNPYDPSQDQDAPTVTSFLVSGSQVSWSTDEPALCVLEYRDSGRGDYDHSGMITIMEDLADIKVRTSE